MTFIDALKVRAELRRARRLKNHCARYYRHAKAFVEKTSPGTAFTGVVLHAQREGLDIHIHEVGMEEGKWITPKA